MISQDGGETAKKKFVILVCSAHPNAADDLVAHLQSSADGEELLTRLAFDPQVAVNLESALPQLEQGLDGRKHVFVFVYEDFADRLTMREMTLLRNRSWIGPLGLAVVGVTDNAAKKAHMIKDLGITRVFPPSGNVKTDIYPAMEGAARELADQRSARAAADAAAAATRQGTVKEIILNPREGLLPERGVIVVHATKGGTGKSAISANIAWGLSESRPTALVDFNPDGAYVDTEFSSFLWGRRGGSFDNRDEMLDNSGLTFLVPSLQHKAAFPVQGDRLTSALLDIRHDGKVLRLLSGIGDQTGYEIAGRMTAAGASLYETKWISDMINRLRAEGPGGHRYVVIDTGTNQAMIKLAPAAMAVADALVVVLDARKASSIEIEARAFRQLIEKNEVPLTARRILVINQAPSQKDNPYAPKIDWIVREFEFFKPTVPPVVIPFDALSFGRAGSKGVPVLADASFTDEAGPARPALRRLVNKIALIYPDAPNAKPVKAARRGFLSHLMG